MSEVQSIQNIIEICNTVKERMRSIDRSNFVGEKFGEEEEYSYKGLLDGVDSLLTDIQTLVKKPDQFLKISLYAERQQIHNVLVPLSSQLKDPGNLYVNCNELKKAIRPFHIRYTKDRFINFANGLSELTIKKQILATNLKELENELKITADNKEKLDVIIKNAEAQKEQLVANETKLQELGGNIDNANNIQQQLVEIKNNVDAHKEVINSFIQKIASREVELENQTAKTNDYNEQLLKFETERTELLEKASELTEEATTALRYGKTKGISDAFRKRLSRLEPEYKWFWRWKRFFNMDVLWLAGAVLSISGAAYLSYGFFTIEGMATQPLNYIFIRLSALSLPIAATWFCAGQYTKLKNITEDYAYKTMLAESIVAFSDQLKNQEDGGVSYQDYMKKMLEEMHQHPLIDHKKKQDKNFDNKAFEQMKETMKETIKETINETFKKKE